MEGDPQPNTRGGASDRPKRLAGFALLGRLGKGGMGTVLKARQLSMDRLVALKILPKHLAQNADFVKRFIREARSAAKLRHPHIVQAYDVGRAEGVYYFAMEFVDGEGLDRTLRRDGPLEPARALGLLKQVCSALAAAHKAGIVHRDIKPSNLMLDTEGQVRVTDFGLAKQTEGDIVVTQTGQSLGSPAYISPEMAKGQEADARSDLYSLGAAFYHLLAGEPPFTGQNYGELIVKHVTETPRPLSQLAPNVDPSLCHVVDRLLRKNPEARYPSADALLAELDALGELKPPGEVARARGRAMIAGAATKTLGAARRLERQAAIEAHRRRADGRRRKTAIVGAVAGAALLLVAAVVIWAVTRTGGTPPRPKAVVPKPTPPKPKVDRAEEAARRLFRAADRALGAKRLRAAAKYLDQLDADYAATKFHAANRAAIAALRSKLTPPKPTPEKPKPPVKPTPLKPEPPVAARFFHGRLRRLPDGRVELFYDWSDPDQLRDWKPTAATHPTVTEGELRIAGQAARGMRHACSFTGDIELNAIWCMRETRSSKASCVVSFCAGDPGGYGLLLRDGNPWLYKNHGTRPLRRGTLSCANGQPHKLRFVRVADSLKAWLDGKLVFDARDPDHTDGGVGLGLWSAYVSFDDFRITGRLDPAWLKQHPDAAKQVAAAPLVGEAEAVPRVFHGRLRRLPDGRVELFYDWSDAAQLKDWVRKAGTQPALADGELRLGGRGGCTMWHAASLVGDMELACEWSVRKAFGGEGSCTVSLCRGPERCYALVLKGANSRIYKNKGTKVIGWLKGSFAIGQWHRARFIRAGDRLEAWVNGVSRKSLRDPELTQGAAALSAWNAEVAYRDVRIVGRLDPAWLNEHPDAAKQVAAAPLADEAPPQPPQPRVGEPGATAREELLAKLKPLWARRAYGEALDAAKRATAEAKEEAAREAMEPCARAAALLAGFWKGVHDGAERLKGKPFHLKGIKYTVAGVKGDSLLLAMGPAQTSRKLSTLAQTDLLALARAGLEAKAGEARLAVGLFLLFDAEPDVAAAHAEFAAAKKAGADADSIPALAGAATAPAFEKALAEAEAKLDAADYDAAAKAIARARGLRPDSKQPAELIDKAFVRVMTQCLACCKSADFAKARSLLRSANALKSKDRDVATLAAWLKAASKPMFTDTFEGKKLGNWEPEVGSWKPLDGKLACTIGSSEGQLYLKGTRPKDFVLTAEVMNQGVGFSYGLLFRHAGKRFLFFVMSDQFNGVNAGGASRWSYGPRGPVDGLKAERVDVPARYDVETKRTYRLTVRCLGKDIECYLDGVLALRLTDEKPAPGKIGLYGHRGDFRFDNFRLYRAVALPKLRCVPLP